MADPIVARRWQVWIIYLGIGAAFWLLIGLGWYLVWVRPSIRAELASELAFGLRDSAHQFWITNMGVTESAGAMAGEKPPVPGQAGAAARAWQKYLAGARADPYREIRSYRQERSGDVIWFDAEIRGMAYLRQMCVALPASADPPQNYVAFALVHVNLVRVEQWAAVAYSPSRPDRVYVAVLPSYAELGKLCRQSVAGYDWKRAFDPDPALWTHVYSISAEYPQFGHLARRD